MSTRSTASGNPAAALSAFASVLWREVVSIFVLSVLFVMASLSVVSIGPALISLVDTFYASTTFTGTGGGVPRRVPDRANYFVKNIWTYLKTGLGYTVIVLLGYGGVYYYYHLALYGRTLNTFVVGILGLYATVLIFVLLFRAANIVVHADEDERPGLLGAFRAGWSSITGNLAYTAIHLVIAAIIVVLCRITILTLVVPMPALLALLEVVMYEELDGIGAKTLMYAYKDPQS